jgi:hypothetical protein
MKNTAGCSSFSQRMLVVEAAGLEPTEAVIGLAAAKATD